jgi:hypothetical protein
MNTIALPLAADVETWARHAWTDGLQIETLPNLERLAVCTRNTVYEITILSAHTGKVLVRGGQFFPDYTEAYLAGASMGSSFLKRHGIYLGFQMELHHEGQRIVTTNVRSITRTTDQRVQ